MTYDKDMGYIMEKGTPSTDRTPSLLSDFDVSTLFMILLSFRMMYYYALTQVVAGA